MEEQAALRFFFSMPMLSPGAGRRFSGKTRPHDPARRVPAASGGNSP
jgi:hypothetical protein